MQHNIYNINQKRKEELLVIESMKLNISMLLLIWDPIGEMKSKTIRKFYNKNKKWLISNKERRKIKINIL